MSASSNARLSNTLINPYSIATFVSPLVWFDQAYASCIAENEINWNAVLSELVFVETVTRLDNYDGPQKSLSLFMM